MDFLPDKEIGNAQVRDRVMKMKEEKLLEMSNEMAEKQRLEKHDVIAYISEIPVNLYEGEIMIMREGIPRKLDEFSPINTTESTISKFYIFSPNDEEIRQCIREYAEENSGLKIENNSD